jgi:hypothetical protein
MTTVNYPVKGDCRAAVSFRLEALSVSPVPGHEPYVERVAQTILSPGNFSRLDGRARYVGVTDRFIDVIRTFDTPAGHTPPGFRIELSLQSGGLLEADLVRDISYDVDGIKRPTGVIYSADSANPYEVAPIAPLLGNLTCNPGIVYDLFINNPKANVGGKFTTRDEVMTELGRILGPGVDVSVELNNPFEEDFDAILAECELFKGILSEYRLVIKVPHTGPVNAANVGELLEGDGRFSLPYQHPATTDALRGHNLALRLREHGYRINYTLMFEPYQTQLALQAKPYFINSFVRHRAKQSQAVQRLLGLYDLTGEAQQLVALREVLLSGDYLPKGDTDHDLNDVARIGRDLLRYRRFDEAAGADGLDGVRHNLRLLRHCNLPDTRLIICSMEGDDNYPDIDRLLTEPEFDDVVDRIIITAEPAYLARFTSANQVVSYQRRFMRAAVGQS